MDIRGAPRQCQNKVLAYELRARVAMRIDMERSQPCLHGNYYERAGEAASIGVVMIELGKTQCLNIVKVTDFGVYLGTEEDKVLLPKKQVPEDVEVGDALTVFVYRDSSDRLIATTNKPKIQLGELKRLKVSQVTGIGAFLDWGLEKDLLMPYKEQTTHVSEGSEYLVALYIDKSGRLAAAEHPKP